MTKKKRKKPSDGPPPVKREMRLPAKLAIKTINEVLEDLREGPWRPDRESELTQRRFEVGMAEAEHYLHERAREYFRLEAERERREHAIDLSKKGVEARRKAAPKWQAEIREDVERRIRSGASDRAIALALADRVDRKDKVVREFAAKVRKKIFPRKK